MKKKTKIILLVVAILVIAFIAVVAFMVTSDFKQEAELDKELDSLYALLNNYPLDYEALDKQLATIVTTDDCAKVEKAVKEYSKDFLNYMKQLDTILSNETLVNALNIENIKEDGPNFVNTKKILSESKTTLESVSTDYANYLTEEVALSYIKDMDLDEYYINIYKQFVLGDNLAEMEATRNDIIKNLDDVKVLIENEEEGIDFLVKNKGSWEVDNDQLVFYSDSLINQYNSIVAKINGAE